MISKKQFSELMESLKNIESKLDVLISFQRATMPKPKVSTEERKILKLCDKKHTMDDIIIKTGKTRTNVGFILSQLRRKGLIKSMRLKGKLVYGRI